MKQTPEKKTPISIVKKAVYNAEEERKLCVIGKKISDARQERGVGMRELQRLLKDRGPTSAMRRCFAGRMERPCPTPIS